MAFYDKEVAHFRPSIIVGVVVIVGGVVVVVLVVLLLLLFYLISINIIIVFVIGGTPRLQRNTRCRGNAVTALVVLFYKCSVPYLGDGITHAG